MGFFVYFVSFMIFIGQIVPSEQAASRYKGPAIPEKNASRYKGSQVAERILGTKYPPCCGDIIGSVTCKRLKNGNPQIFQKKCDNDPDFSLIQCCNACGIQGAAERYEQFFADGERSQHCFDRHEKQYCDKFLERSDVWSPGKWSCSGENAHLAFRICRKTCKYCNANLYNTAPNGGKWKPSPCGAPPVAVNNTAIIT
uniref:ShKT domain-containing protein n=1 Tax=Panagrellus redivivus TaxID=6233 RepID=A0A7E4VYY9_PANRE